MVVALWANKDDLVVAALHHYRTTHTLALPDTGSLRNDLMEALDGMSSTRPAFFAVTAAASFSGLMAGTGATPIQIRDRILGTDRETRAHSIYRRAHDRGEIDMTALPAAVLTLPFDLVRHDLFMTLEPLPPERLHAIVDEITLPLIRHYCP